MNSTRKLLAVFAVLGTVFLGLAAAFIVDPWGHPPVHRSIPLVDTNFLSMATARQSYAELIRLGEDLSDFNCYACHEKGIPPPLRFDTNQVLIIPPEHANIVMGHGSHNRNNNCYNCHDELNLEQFQTRDGRTLKLIDSTPLCGSCHGPTYRDWEGGAHGRTGGFWHRASGETTRRNCVECHDPHAPKFPGREPAPGPHPLHSLAPSGDETQPPH
jgi:hypothetical protein